MSEPNSYCTKCGSEIASGNNFCPKCGFSILSNTSSKETIRKKPVPMKKSNWWYLLPIFVGLIGAIIAYFILRKDDPILAKMCFPVGVGSTIVGVGFQIILAAMEMAVLFAGQYIILGLFVCVIGGVIIYGAIRLGKKKLEDTNSTGENYE